MTESELSEHIEMINNTSEEEWEEFLEWLLGDDYEVLDAQNN